MAWPEIARAMADRNEKIAQLEDDLYNERAENERLERELAEAREENAKLVHSVKMMERCQIANLEACKDAVWPHRRAAHAAALEHIQARKDQALGIVDEEVERMITEFDDGHHAPHRERCASFCECYGLTSLEELGANIKRRLAAYLAEQEASPTPDNPEGT